MMEMYHGDESYYEAIRLEKEQALYEYECNEKFED